MRLLTPPWKTAWYDDGLADKFFQELSKTEIQATTQLETTAKWMEQMMIEFGQLAQNMIQLENSSPATAQIRMAYERAMKVSVLATHLASALDRADPDRQHTPVGHPPGKIGASVPIRSQQSISRSNTAVGANSNNDGSSGPPKQTILNLSRKGLSITEIEMVTGESRGSIETVLAANG